MRRKYPSSLPRLISAFSSQRLFEAASRLAFPCTPGLSKRGCSRSKRIVLQSYPAPKDRLRSFGQRQKVKTFRGDIRAGASIRAGQAPSISPLLVRIRRRDPNIPRKTGSPFVPPARICENRGWFSGNRNHHLPGQADEVFWGRDNFQRR